jgi:hypothetical protein
MTRKASAATRTKAEHLRDTQRRRDAQQQREQRYQTVGRMLEAAGLLVWSDADLAAVIEVLRLLLEAPNPGAVLASILQGMDGTLSTSLTLPLVVQGAGVETREIVRNLE